MKIKNKQFILSVIGAILIIVNGVWIAIEGKPIIVSSYTAASLDELNGNWGRISFGMPTMTQGMATFIWLFLAVGNLLLILMLHLSKKNQFYYGFSTLFLSLSSLPIGGGFFIGMILTIARSMMAIENKPFKETFLGKILRAARFDLTLYESVKNDLNALRTATITIIFLNILTGIGNSLYVLNATKIINAHLASPETVANILLKGELVYDVTVFGVLATYIGLAVIKWLLFSTILYFVIWITSRNVEFKTMACCVAFAYAPIAIQLFMPMVLFNQPLLTGEWPITFILVSNLWMGIALTFAIKKTANFNLPRALGSTILGSAIYYLINYGFIEQNFAIQGVRLTVISASQPNEILEMFFSIAVLLAVVLGVFSTHEQKATSMPL